jgi:penicillin-binding protein 2
MTLPDGRGGEKKYKCWKRHGIVDYWRAMSESCDSYFYSLGQKVGSQAINEYAQLFGYGQSVQGTLSGENKGVAPSPLWKKKMGLGGWSTGDTYNMAIGQGFVTATPLQVTMMMMGIANRGDIYQLYAVDRIVDVAGNIRVKNNPVLIRKIQLKENTWNMIDQSLENVVTQGTGGATRIAHLTVRGKTGTAQNPHGDDHAWFAGYAGYKNEPPSVAICVFVENGGHGGAVAAPIVKNMLEAALPPKQEVEQK